ncbi:MAG: YceI family protein [Bacteroidales bacterium]|nr:YceI family protein [Bacteroidales bacterium]
MKAIKSILAIALLMISLGGFSQNLAVDTQNSIIKWHGKKVTGEHFGTIKLKDASLKMIDNAIVGGEFTIDMATINNTDIEDATYKAKLEGHLKSDDFFSVEKFPTSKLIIKSSTPFVNNVANVKADLTIKGITHPLEFEVRKMDTKFTAEIVVDRSKFDVKYNSGSFFKNLGDKLIYDDFTLTVAIVTEK